MEFAHLGAHCDVKTCRQRDFLPFTCDCCDGTFCLDHRSYRTHECPKAAELDSVAIKCPLCSQAFKLGAGEDANVAWERHSRDGCDPDGRKARVKKPRCDVKGCREKLVFSNRYDCTSCGQAVCLQHRFADAHKCREVAASKRTSWLDNITGRGGGRRGGAGGGGAGGKPKPKPASSSARRKAAAAKRARTAADDPANTLRGTAERRRLAAEGRLAGGGGGGGGGGGTVVDVPRTRAAPEPLSAAAIAASSGPERCPTCGARFGGVEELIAHVTAYHDSAAAPAPVAGAPPAAPHAPRGSGREVCPHCGDRFSDPVELVGHVEAVHRRAEVAAQHDSRQTCAVS